MARALAAQVKKSAGVLAFVLISAALMASPLDGGVPASPPSSVTIHGAFELEGAAMPSGPTGGEYDGFLGLRPVFGFAVDDAFAIELGPQFRLRLIDSAPEQRSADIGGVLRRRDWDQASDFGQIIASLRIAPDSSVFLIRAGAVRKRTLGMGHLINRYSNQENPDYHPAAATVVIAPGPVRFELFDSDLLGLRVFAAEAAWDLGRTFSSSPDVFDRYTLALQIAHDLSLSGLPPDSVTMQAMSLQQQLTLMQLDASVVFVRRDRVQFMGMLGFGSRFNQAANAGFLAGLAVDLNARDLAFSLKIEGRKQAGGFRQGMVGPAYELSRFAGIGLTGVPLAQEMLPDTFSLYGETRVKVNELVSVDAMVEHFAFGRTDFDATVNVNSPQQWVVVGARFIAVGMGVAPRFAVTANTRIRLFKSFYVLASGGTIFFPQADGSLNRGVTFSAGAGVDFER